MNSNGIRCRAVLGRRETHNYGSAANYAQTVRNYVNEYHKWNNSLRTWNAQQTEFQNIHLSNAAQVQQSTLHAHVFPNIGENGFASEYEPASMLRRVFAEAIDTFLCLIFKLFFVLALIEMEFIDISQYEKLIEEDHDITDFIVMTQALLPLEMLCKVVCSFLEGVLMSLKFGPFVKGQTPGKWIVGIRVIGAPVVTPSANPTHVRIQGAHEITFKQSMTRAFLKNLIMNSLFPFSTAAVHISTTRSFYDAMLKTIVVVN